MFSSTITLNTKDSTDRILNKKQEQLSNIIITKKKRERKKKKKPIYDKQQQSNEESCIFYEGVEKGNKDRITGITKRKRVLSNTRTYFVNKKNHTFPSKLEQSNALKITFS